MGAPQRADFQGQGGAGNRRRANRLTKSSATTTSARHADGGRHLRADHDPFRRGLNKVGFRHGDRCRCRAEGVQSSARVETMMVYLGRRNIDRAPTSLDLIRHPRHCKTMDVDRAQRAHGRVRLRSVRGSAMDAIPCRHEASRSIKASAVCARRNAHTSRYVRLRRAMAICRSNPGYRCHRGGSNNNKRSRNTTR